MPNQEVGVDSIFETRQFTAGLGRYIQGLADAVRETGLAVTAVNAFGAQTVTQMNAILGQATGTAQAIQAVTSAIKAANAASAAFIPPPPPASSGPSLADQLAQTRLINEEIRDRVALENLVAQSQDAQLTALQRIKNANEQNRLAVLRDLRDQEAAQVQLNQAQLDAIRNEATTPRDTGKDARQELNDQLKLAALLQQAFRARIAEEQTKLTLQNQSLTVLAREKALIDQGTQALEAQRRVQEALQISATAAARVRRANVIPVEEADLGVKGRDPLDDALRVQRLIADELRSQIRLKQAQITIDDAASSGLRKRQAEIEKETALLEQQKRARDITLSGGSLAQLEAARKINVTLQDLGEKQRDALQNQLTLQGLLSAEVRDRVAEEQARLVIMSRQSTELQKQAAQLQLQTISANRQQRSTTAQTLNIPGSTAAIANIRNTTVATRDLNKEVQKVTTSFKGMSASSAALAVTVGNLAAGAIRSAVQGFISLGSTILEQVTFFERMDLSIQFFAARSAIAEDATLSFEDALAKTTEQSQALSFWLQQLAISSPFTTRDVSTIFRTAQAYGLTRQEAELLTPLLLDFASASGLTSDVLERLALAFGQVRSRGKLTGEEVRQLGNSGLPIRDILVKALGIANEEFDELLESGALTSDVVLPAIVQAMKVFEGQAERISFGSIGGIVSAFQELQEITTATFFRGVLGPLVDDFKEFFSVVNQPTTLAFVKLLGEELGGNLQDAVHGLVGNIQGLIAQWQQLDPVMKQQILVFGGVLALTLAVAGAIGLLTVAFGLLTNPIILVATTFAFFVSEYTSNFAVLNEITGGFITTVQGIPGAVARSLSGAANATSKILGYIASDFGRLATDMTLWGRQVVREFAQGAVSAVNALLPVFTLISRLFAFNLAPGSPPRVAPEIDKWGTATMEEYVKGFGVANVRKPLEGAFTIVSDTITEEMIASRQEAVDALNAAHPDLGLTVAASLLQTVKDAGADVGPALASSVEASTDKADFGSIGVAVSQEFVDGFIKTLPVLIPRMDAELKEILGRIGGGAQLSLAGAFSMNQYLDGFKKADFSLLDQATGVVQGVLQSLVDLGELDELDMQRILFGSSESIAKALEEFRQIGSISQRTLAQVSKSAGRAGTFVVELLVDYQKLATANAAVDQAQKDLNQTTEHYTSILKPLQDQLDKINETVNVNNEEQRILSLRRLIANEAVSDFRKQNARDEIAQIMAERRVRNLEEERDTAVEGAEDTLKAREKERDALQESFDLLQARIDAQLAQLGLVAQEGGILKDLQEEALKLREKQKTELELQQEMLRLQNEEMGDLIKAAKAKLVLDDATSSEYERQQALLDLQEVAISRRNRLLEAAEFGIPESELTKIRDLIPTMDDLGIKEGKEKFTSDMSAITEGLVDVKSITEQIEEATQQVRDRWTETKAEIIATFTEMNANLPSFLQFLPEGEDGKIPILDNLTSLAKAIGLVAGAITAWKFVKLIIDTKNALSGLFLVVNGGAALSGAAGAAGAAGGAAGAAGGLTTFGIAVASLGAIALAATGYFVALKLAMDAVAFNETNRFEVNQGEIDANLGESKKPLQSAIDKLFTDVKPSPEARAVLAQMIIDTFNFSSQEAEQHGFGDTHISESIGNAINQAILIDHLIADTPENRAAIATFKTDVLGLLATTATGPEKGTYTLLSDEQFAVLTPEAEAKATTDFNAFLAGITNAETQGTFATNVAGLVQAGVDTGMTDAGIDTLVFNAFNEGVKAGLVKDSPENRTAIQEYIDGLIVEMRSAAEIESPSGLTAREVGEPMGLGIPKGIIDALGSADGKTAIETALTNMLSTVKAAAEGFKAELTADFAAARKDVLTDSEAIKTGVISDFDVMDTKVTLGSTNLVKALAKDWAAIYLDSLTQSEAIKVDTLADFTALNADLLIGMATIHRTVVGEFTLMRTESETQVETLRTNVGATLFGKEDSLLTDIKAGFLGQDNLVPHTIGKNFMQALGEGIEASKVSLAKTIASALGSALVEAGTGISNVVLAPALLSSGLTPQQPSTQPSASMSSSRTTNLYLTVNTAAQSQGVIADFGIMQTLAGA